MDPEGLLIETINLSDALEGLEAYADVPRLRPGRFITLELTGGPVERYRSVPVLAVQVWAPSRAEASRLAGLVARWLNEDLPADPRVGRVNVSSVYNFPDVEARHPRYQITVELVTQTV